MQKQGSFFGTQVVFSGTMADFHVEKYKLKMKHRQFDCGIDIYPSKVIEQYRWGYRRAGIKVGTDLVITPTPGAWGWLTDRSSSMSKLGGGRIRDGKIDAGYTGELLFIVIGDFEDTDNMVTAINQCIKDELAIGQYIPMIHLMPAIVMKSEAGLILPAIGGRGANGFGSTDGLKA
jgi:dUTPase